MTDLSKTIAAKSDQLNADDILGNPITIKISRVSGSDGEQPISVHYEGDNGKPWKPCKSMRRVLVNVWGKDGNSFVGRSLTLYRDDKVKFGGLEVGGIRISHASHIDAPITMALTASKANKKPFTVKPLASDKATEKAAESTLPQSIIDKLMTNGQAAASKGVASYTEWLKPLDDKAKAVIKHMHKEWSALAKESDKNREEEIPL